MSSPLLRTGQPHLGPPLSPCLPAFGERHARALAAGITALAHVGVFVALLWTQTYSPANLPPPPAERTQLILLPPRAPEVPLEEIVAPTPSTAASVAKQKPEPPRPLPQTPPRATANWVIPPPTPPQPTTDSPAPQQQEASVAAAPPSPVLPIPPVNKSCVAALSPLPTVVAG